MPEHPPAPGPTLADIARAAEVSTATVSHALNGTGRLGASTRRRVREVAGALGYGARRGPRTRTLGVAVTTYAGDAWDFVEIAYFSRLLTAATSAAHAHGYALTTLPADRGAEPLWHTLSVDGMLLLDSPAGDPVLRALRARGLPVVFDGRPPDPWPGDVWVDNDHTATTREVLDHLAASGARRIALHSGYGREFYTGAVTSAYEQWCAERGLAPLLVPFAPDDTAGHAFDSAFTGPDRPDAVYCVYDPGGRQVLAAAARHGLRIPGSAPGVPGVPGVPGTPGTPGGSGRDGGLLLVCASEDPAYAETEPAVTTVTLDPERIAASAVSVLVNLIESGHAETPGQRTVPAGLRVRASSLPPDMY
ncbi:DNA-binding LacI/PurR family transcriptional regulator [Streptomyces sp. CG 926]|uniref:LacI family DNA-binding transcriptional regulator n=1 Tax=Streptomyces sp. CG 926 TaxID=1882405 RepID=UPI000D7B0B66|nr:LacI family DNA-binding transcriptional regulator [Streptomyces sp. CG 926]PWK75008.1 DNA-binding LacI/PurR family transcriptional regulator [Streptomyces sp. CG 926]